MAYKTGYNFQFEESTDVLKEQSTGDEVLDNLRCNNCHILIIQGGVMVHEEVFITGSMNRDRELSFIHNKSYTGFAEDSFEESPPYIDDEEVNEIVYRCAKCKKLFDLEVSTALDEVLDY